MFQNMGPSPSPRHSLTMTAVKERMFVIGGEMKLGGKTEDTGIYILDSGMSKYIIVSIFFCAHNLFFA